MDSEFAVEGAAEGSGVPDNRPLIERIVDKNWKTRQLAYDELKKVVGAVDDEALFSEFAPVIAKMTSDVNPAALDAGLDAALSFVDVAPAGSTKAFAERVAGNVIDKAFGARPVTTNKGKTLLLKMMEVDEAGPVVSVLLSKLNDKKPKIPPTCLEVLREGLAAFGVRAFPVKEMITALGPVLEGSNGPAREVAMLLLVDVFRWIGKAPLHALLEKLRSAQTTEFDRLCAEKAAEGKPSPSLWLRKDRPLPGSEAASGAAVQKADTVDAREFVDEVDLGKRLKASDFAKLVAEEKWSEQLNGLQIVIDALGPAPKIKSGCDVHDVMAACKGFLRAGHVQVQVSTLRVIALLADGLRSEFGPAVRPMVQSIILKCKEKRLVPEVQTALLSIVKHCCSFESMVEDLKEQISNKKVPTYGRTCLLEFTTQTLVEMSERVSVDCLKPMVEACSSCCEDSDPKIRECCVYALTALHKIVKSKGKSAAEANRLLLGLENSCPRVFKKIQEGQTGPAAGGASASVSASTSSISSAASTAAPKKADSEPTTSTASVAAPKRPAVSSSSSSSSSLPKKAPSTSSSASSAPAKKAAGGGSGAASSAQEDDTVEELAMSIEDAISALAALEIPGWDGPAHALMDSDKWQEKVEALDAINKAISERKVGGQVSAALVMYLSQKTKAFKISNVNILKSIIQVACSAAQNVGDVKFNKSAAWTLLKEFGDKLSDKKTKEPVESLLTALSEATSPAFVIRRMKVVMDKVKAPLAHQFYLEWLKQAVSDFGASSFPVPAVAQFCAAEMDNKDGKVRTAAVEVFGALYHQLGPRMQSMAFGEDTKPQLKALIEAEFAKVGYDPSACASATRKGDVGEASVSALPRQDILALLDKNIMAELSLTEGKTSWTNRKVALEAVVAACERSGHFLEANKGLVELVRGMKPRLNDTQANLKPIAAAAIGNIIASLDLTAAGKVLRIIAEPLLGGLADNKKGMRDATVAALQMAVTLNKGGETGPAESGVIAVLVAPVAEALSNPVGRQELLDWILKQQETIRCDVTELAVPLVLCLQDKTASVRASAEQLLVALSARSALSRATIDKSTRDLPPATKRTLTSSIDKVMAAYGTASAETPVVASVAAAAATAATAAAAPAATPVVDVSSVAPLLPPAAPVADAAPMPPVPPTVQAEKEKVATKAAPPVVVQTEEPASVAAAAAGGGVSGAAAPPSPSRDGGWLLKKTTKSKRLDEFYRLNWPQPPEDPSDAEVSALRSSWEPLLSADLVALVFPVMKGGALVNHDSFIAAINELTNQLQGPHALQHVDLILRWCCYVLGVRESSTGLLKVIQLVIDCFSLVQKSADGAQLHESEILSILPHLIDKSGHKSERHKVLFKAAIAAAGAVVAPTKLNQYLLAGLACKNKKTRVVCIEEIQRVVEVAGAASLGRAGVKEIGTFLDAKDNDALGRNACLELCYALYVSLGADLPKLMKLLGDLSERSVSLIDDRIKQKNKSGAPAPKAAAAPPTATTVSQPSVATTTVAATPDKRPATAPVVHSAVKAEDHGVSPFRLEMTPPEDAAVPSGAEAAANPRGAATGVTPVSLEMGDGNDSSVGLVPTWTKTPGPVTVRAKNTTPRLPELASALGAATFPSPQQQQPPTPSSAKRMSTVPAAATAEIEDVYNEIVSKIDKLLLDDRSDLMLASDPVHEQAVDYIKILHTIVVGEWIKERLPEDDALLRAHSNALVVRLVACLSRAFDKPVLMSMESEGSHLNFDVALASCSLGTLFAMSKRSDIVQQLPSQTIVSILGECLHRLVDDRITSTEDENAVQTVRALNMISFKLTAELGAGNALAALLDIVGSCGRTLPAVSAKPTSRLLQRLLTEEVRRPQPFTAPSAEPSVLLQKLDDFFAAFSSESVVENGSEAQELAFSCGKTVLSEMIKALSVKTVLSIGTDTLGMTNSSPIIKLAAKMGGVLMETNPELQARVVSLIDDITSARDKTLVIRELHLLRKQHPELDMNQYLQRVSPVFRRYVLDSLSKIDEQDSSAGGAGGDEKENSTGAFEAPLDKTSSVPPSKQTSVVAVSDSSSEAMRILEGIKSRTSALKTLGGENSTFIAASQVGVAAKVEAPVLASVPAVATSSDNDSIMARLARLKEMNSRR